MRYRGGGIGHGYMREVEDRFDDMRREQVDPEVAPQATQLPQDGDDSTEGPLAGAVETTDSAGNASMAHDDSDGDFEEEIPDERLENYPTEDEYLSGEDSDEGGDGDGDGQGTYGMAEY